MLDDIVYMCYLGLVEGSILALIALGYSLVYGVGGVNNLANGHYYMLAGYFFLWILGWSNIFKDFVILTVILGLSLITLIGALTYIVLVKPLQNSTINMILITFALAVLIELAVLHISGTQPEPVQELRMLRGYVTVLGRQMDRQNLLLIVLSLLIVGIFGLFINKSKLGKSIRAVSQDREAASLMGINSDRILLITFIISAFLAGIAAVLYVPSQNLTGPSMGWQTLTSSMAIVIFGGLGSLKGSIVGAYFISFTSKFTLVFIPAGEAWETLVPLVVIVIMLLIRPYGLFGKKEL
ncbi:MAG: branched-chain amino acid ABC transporter permease [Promethearchaeota archaeon]